MASKPTSLFALDQEVEVFNGLRWSPAKITAIRLTSHGLFYEVEGGGVTASVGPASLRPVGAAMPGSIVVITWTADGIFYQVKGPVAPSTEPKRGLHLVRAPAGPNE